MMPDAVIEEPSLPNDSGGLIGSLFKLTDDGRELSVVRNLHDGMQMIRHQQGDGAEPSFCFMKMLDGLDDTIGPFRPAKVIESTVPATKSDKKIGMLDAIRCFRAEPISHIGLNLRKRKRVRSKPKVINW